MKDFPAARAFSAGARPLPETRKKDSVKLLSIAVPSYNVENTLEQTLRSLCLPALLPELDIIVVDDGSSDGTAALAGTFAARWPDSVRVISQQNKGHGGAVNTGLAAAHGQYFKVVDGDDTLSALGLGTLIECLRRAPADLVLAHYERIPADDPKNPEPMRFDGVEYDRVYQFNELPLENGLYFGIHAMTARTSVLRRSGMRLQEHTFYVDVEYGLLPLPAVETVCFLNAVVYRYAVGRAGQSVAAANFVRHYDDHLRVLKRLSAFVSGEALSGAKKEYAYSVLRKLCFTQYMIAAFYDTDSARGGWRARRLDAWLRKADGTLYAMMGENAYLRLLRRTRFLFLRSPGAKALLLRLYTLLRPLLSRRRKRRFTY